MYTLEDKLVGFQVRTDSGKPKYLTFTTNEVPTKVYGEGRILFIVEDMLSALNLTRFPNGCALPLFGTNLTSSHISTILKLKAQDKIDEVRVWLDNDNHQVIRKSVEMLSRLRGYLPCVRVTANEQPKEFKVVDLIGDT